MPFIYMYQKSFTEEKMNKKITTQICERSIGGEINAEISMPDYEPEIRRLLRVEVSLTPPAGYCDGARVGMSGDAIFRVLYAGNDGELYSTSAIESYELTEALKPSERETDVTCSICSVTPESIISRASAPRRISIKCKLRGQGRYFGERGLGEDPGLDIGSVERLVRECEYAKINAPVFAEARLSDDFAIALPAGSSGDARIVSYSPSAVASGIECSEGEATVRGELTLDLLLSADDGSSPFRATRKIPFSETIVADGIDRGCRCVAAISCPDCQFTVDENRIFCEPTLVIRLDAERNVTAEYTADAYSTEALSECDRLLLEFPICERTFSGSITSSIRQSIEEAGIDASAEIIHASPFAVVKSIDKNGKKFCVVGEICFNILTKYEKDYLIKELRQPFKYELDTGESPVSHADCRVIPLPAEAKIDNGRLCCDCELHIFGIIHSGSSIDTVQKVTLGDPVEHEEATTVCFPSPTDTVWDVSKRYHIPTSAIISQESELKNHKPIIF